MRNIKSRSLVSYLLIISIFLFISVVGFNFIVEAVSSASILSINLNSPTYSWSAGETKDISVRYTNFDTINSTFYVWICNPRTYDCSRFGWPLDNLNLFGPGNVRISRTIGPFVYDRITAKDSAITPYYDGYRAMLKICPSTLSGSASSYGCRYSSIFTITGPKLNVPTITSATVNLGLFKTWVSGQTKTVNVNYSNFTGDTKTFQVGICNPETDLCGAINPVIGLNLTGSGAVSFDKTTGAMVYSRLIANDIDITPYYSTSTFNGSTVYNGRLKICPSSLSGVVPAGAICTYTSSFMIGNPSATPTPVVGTARINDITNGWPQNTAKTINFNYANFSGDTKTVEISFCHPQNSSSCQLLPQGASLNLSGSSASSISKTFPISDLNTPYFSNGYTKLKVCPSTDSGVVTSTLGCSYTPNFLVTAVPVVVNPSIYSTSIDGITDGWLAGDTKTVNVAYRNFADDTNTLKVTTCRLNPDAGTWTCGGISVVSGLNLVGNNSISFDKTIGVNGNEPYQGKLKICPSSSSGVVPSGTCVFTAPFEVKATPVVVHPTVSSVTISDIASGWLQGTSKTLTFSHSNFDNTTKYVKAQICHPQATLTQTEKCLLLVTTPNTDGGPYSSPGTVNITKGIGPIVYNRISSPEDDSLKNYFNESYQTKWKVCPANSAGVITPGTVCAFSSVFAVTGSDIGSGSGGSSGQGCFVDECVCVNGMEMKCGRPMQPGIGCDLDDCDAYEVSQSSLSSKLTASLSFLTDGFINLFLK
jgi:hypothetical protein